MDNTEYAIWWLSPSECNAIDSDYTGQLHDGAPKYLSAKFLSLRGRPGRGRLWVPDDIDVQDISWTDDAIGRWCENCGGIVFWRKDLEHVMHYPGLITDLNMKRI